MATKRSFLLTGDIGGTNSRMGLYDVGSSVPLAVKFYLNEEHLEEAIDGVFEQKIIAPFLKHCWDTVEGMPVLREAEIVACLACAGPVQQNKVVMSNLRNICIDGEAVAKSAFTDDVYVKQISVCKLINDFVAQGYGCLTLKPNEVKELVPNSHSMIDPKGPKACVGAGTGLGECFLTPDPSGYSCFPSEGGHVEYNPRTKLEIKLREYLMEKFGYKHRVSIERVVSGRGLANVYEFLAKEFPERVDKAVHEEFLDAGDMQGRVIAINAEEGTLCYDALQIMMAAYGSEVGSAAVKFIPTGGMYVTGGLTPKNIQFIEGNNSEFMKAYFDKGRVVSVLKTVPLFAVMVEDLGVRGAHKAAMQEYAKSLTVNSGEETIDKREDNTAADVIEEGSILASGHTHEPLYSYPLLALAILMSATAGVFLGKLGRS